MFGKKILHLINFYFRYLSEGDIICLDTNGELTKNIEHYSKHFINLVFKWINVFE